MCTGGQTDGQGHVLSQADALTKNFVFVVKTPTQAQLNTTSTKYNLSWVRLENDFAYTPPHKLNVNNISAVTDPIL